MQSNYMEYLAKMSICHPLFMTKQEFFREDKKNMIKFFTLHFSCRLWRPDFLNTYIVSFEKKTTN